MEQIKNEFERLCIIKSDINEHLPTLYEYATNCNSILETGVRGVISSWALLYGLLNNNSNNKKLFLNDLNECDITKLLNETKLLNIEIKYEWISNLELKIDSNYDMIFIDTWHVYGQLKRELNKFAKNINKYIIMHDTTIDEIYGETIRNKWNATEQSIATGIPIEEINKGLGLAIEEFLNENKEWILEKKFINNNGLTILKKIIH